MSDLLTETFEDKLHFEELFLYYEYVRSLRKCSFLTSGSDFVDTVYCENSAEYSIHLIESVNITNSMELSVAYGTRGFVTVFTSAYPEPDESNPYCPIQFLRSI
jgi:hypothetical protein